ncbi:hypothetical protein [Streptomyces decoyicus]|uniref:hypothetical protein n=1 Tax=Streptomyces decoyicus TaxID=249567 RepID=UPI000662B115|nr:hypothetical protein [Streptomyces decoyicus]KOG37537.1 hypothetical protein ADK74_35745 [Streptomyces decoyicus]QZY14835.1 hypothetical protein K7C20_05920 [Streptomyces decoyicus]
MTENSSRRVLERLRAIDWADDFAASDHANSRALLMREYLRRAALWARACGAEQSWPFFDVAEHVDAEFQTPPDVAAEVEEVLAGLAPTSLKRTCRAAIRWAALRDVRDDLPADLPDPYEPLLLMYERGGGYYLEEYLDLNGVMIRLGNVESNASATSFVTLAPATLDALDAEGQITYYAKVSEGYPRHKPRGIVRRRIDEGQTYDEAFTRRLRWEPTEYLNLYDLGHNEVDHVKITEIEAAAFIESVTAKILGSPSATP